MILFFLMLSPHLNEEFRFFPLAEPFNEFALEFFIVLSTVLSGFIRANRDAGTTGHTQAFIG